MRPDTLNPIAGAAVRRRSYIEAQRERRTLALRLFCAIVLGVCFWYAVPYQFPLRLDPDPVQAAANEADAFQGSVSRQVAMPVAALLCVFALYRLPHKSAPRPSRLLLCTSGYLLWAVSSLLWSADPTLTRKRLVVFLIDALVAYSLARLATLRELALLGFCCTGVVAGLSFVAHVFVLRDFRPLDPDFRFMGVMTANYQAMNLFVCLACGLVLMLSRSGGRKWFACLLCVFAGLLFLTRARVGTVLFVGVGVVAVRRMMKDSLRLYGRALALILFFACALPALIFSLGRDGSDAVTAVFMMGRHDTENTASLSNPAPLWSELSDSVRQRPWLGTGFAAFWSPQRVQQVSLDQGWVVPHAHNTYLDETLSLGVVGGSLYLAVLTGALGVAWKRYRQQPSPFDLLPLMLLGWLALLGLTESLPLAPCLPTLLAYSCVARMCLQEDEATQSILRREVSRTRLVPVPARASHLGLSPGFRSSQEVRS